MKNSLLVLFCLFILTACNSDTSATEETNTSEMEKVDTSTKTVEANESVANNTYTLTMEDCLGAYVKGGHDASWLILVRDIDGNLEASFFEFEGMLPPVDAFVNEKEVIEETMMTSFILEVDLEKQTFSSELGTGKIDGGQLIFDQQEDGLGDPLTLERDDSFSSAL